MKSKISITLDKEVLKLIENMIHKNNGMFRNRSHVVEYALNKLFNGERK